MAKKEHAERKQLIKDSHKKQVQVQKEHQKGLGSNSGSSEVMPANGFSMGDCNGQLD